MIFGSSLQVPAEKTKFLRLTAKELLKSYNRRTYHLREVGDGLVAAEGEEEFFKLPQSSTGIAVAGGKIFAHEPARKRLHAMNADFSAPEVTYNLTFEPYRLFCFFDKEGVAQYYGVMRQHIYNCIGNSTVRVGEGKGGCGALFRERIFTASGNRVYYCKTFDGSDWSEARYGGGYLELPAEELGDILAMQPYKDKLYLFRKHGITSLRVLGDEINFKAVHMPMKCGKLIANTVALCGENVGYFTDTGFHLFNGAVSTCVPHSRFDEIELTKFIKAVSYCGKYYAFVRRKEGGTAIYCYDPEQGEAHFIENGAADIASGDELYFTRGGYAYKMTEKGIPQNFTPYFTAEKIAFGISGEKMLRSIAVEGEGTFYITVTSNRGTRTVRGTANEALKLRSPLRGNGFAVRIGVEPASALKARFCAVLFRFTEEDE